MAHWGWLCTLLSKSRSTPLNPYPESTQHHLAKPSHPENHLNCKIPISSGHSIPAVKLVGIFNKLAWRVIIVTSPVWLRSQPLHPVMLQMTTWHSHMKLVSTDIRHASSIWLTVRTNMLLVLPAMISFVSNPSGYAGWFDAGVLNWAAAYTWLCPFGSSNI